MEKSLEKVLKELVSKYNGAPVNVDGENYTKQDIDELANRNYLELMDCTTCSGWAYMVTPTYPALHYVEQQKSKRKAPIIEWIRYMELQRHWLSQH